MESATENTPIKPGERKGLRRFFRGCALGCLLPVVVVLFTGWVVLLILNHPKLNAAHAIRVDVTLRKEEEPYTNYLGVVTNLLDVQRLLAVMAKSNGSIMDHKCGESGWFTILYDSGKTRRIDFLPGHDEESYEYRAGIGVHRMNRLEFFQTLQRAGIRTNDFPALDQ